MEGFDLTGYVATGLVMLIVGILLDRWRVRPRLVWFIGPQHTFALNDDQGPFPVNSQTLHIQNMGRIAARNVKAVFLFKPENLNVQPPIDYRDSTTDDGYYVLTFDNVGPQETIEIQVRFYEAIPQIIQVRSDSGPAKAQAVRFVPWVSNWVIRAFLGVAVIGAVVIAITIIRLIILAWENWPFPGT